MEEVEKTVGEIRIRISYADEITNEVQMIKFKFAKLIDECYIMAMTGKDARIGEKAMTALEETCMWMVKLATA